MELAINIIKRFFGFTGLFALAVIVLPSLGRTANYFPRIEVANDSSSPVVTQENTISTPAAPATVSVSTSAWTKLPSAARQTGSVGIVISVPASNSANIVGHLGNCTSTAVATTVRPYELVKGNGFTFFPLAEDVCFWALSLHTSAESVHVQDVK